MKNLVHVVDDDRALREALARRLCVEGYAVRTYASAEEFLGAYVPSRSPACLLLDVRMPGRDGLELQADLAARGADLPIVFLSAHGDVPMSVRAMKAGAGDFLVKPVRDEVLLHAVDEALRRARERLKVRDLKARLARLTPRERTVFERVVAGYPNKAIAADLGIAEITVKVHRGQVMRKLGARSLATLVTTAVALGIGGAGRA